MRESKWIDGAITAKPIAEAGTSWWTLVGSREVFDQTAARELARMNRSKFGRLAVPMGDKGYGDSE